MSVERTKYGTWRARWRDAEGKQHAKSFDRKIEAERHVRAQRVDVDRGAHIDPKLGKVTVAAMADEWLTGAMNLRAGGRGMYERDLTTYILPALGKVRLASLKSADVDAFLRAELDAGLAPSSVHRHYRTLRRMLQVAVDKGRLAKNPCDAVTPPHIPPAEMRFLSVEQVDKLADTIGARYRAWVFVAAYLGLRWSECVGLRRDHLDGNRVTVAGQLKLRGKTFHWEEPKTRAGRRTVTMPKFLVAEMDAHLEQWAGPELVFVNQAGRPMLHGSFTTNVWKPTLVRAGLDRATRIHDLRHTSVALAIAAGAHPKAIQARMGHASIGVTLDRYGHLFPEMDETVAAGLDALRDR